MGGDCKLRLIKQHGHWHHNYVQYYRQVGGVACCGVVVVRQHIAHETNLEPQVKPLERGAVARYSWAKLASGITGEYNGSSSHCAALTERKRCQRSWVRSAD
jgi:hypothetical protein